MKKFLTLFTLVISLSTQAQTYTGPVPPDSWYRTPDQRLPAENTRGGGNNTNNANDVAALGLLLKMVAAKIESDRAAEQAEEHRRIYPHAYPQHKSMYGCQNWREVRAPNGRVYRELECND